LEKGTPSEAANAMCMSRKPPGKPNFGGAGYYEYVPNP
jgi:hypothetical protein